MRRRVGKCVLFPMVRANSPPYLSGFAGLFEEGLRHLAASAMRSLRSS
jgi:hypothetical protein